MKILGNKEILLCPPQPGHCNPCCPKFIDKDDHFIIKDDYNCSIKIDKKDIQPLIKDVHKTISKHWGGLDN